MTHVRIETSVPRHRKFLAAGPAASWLWLAGTCYANEGLTDGHIPALVLPSLGVAGAAKLAAKLVEVGLWDVDPAGDGWHIHDYLEHNRTAGHVKAIREARASGGKLGGRPPKTLPENLQGSPKVSQPETLPENPIGKPIVNVNDSTTSTTPSTAGESDTPFTSPAEAPDHPFPHWLTEWHAAYPKSRQVDRRKIEREFVSAFFRHDIEPPELFGRMMTALEGHKASEEWQRGVIPGMAKWLNEDWWLRVLTPAKASGPQGKPQPDRMAFLKSQEVA